MTATNVKEPGTTVATSKRRTLDIDSAKMEQRFIEAFGKGELNRLSPEEQTLFLMAFGQKIGVRAELGEVMIYQGKPYVTLAGRIRIAHRTGLLNGMFPRPASQHETRAFGATDDEVVWTCEVWRIGISRPFRGWGVASRKNDRNPVAKQFPREMAKKRAKYDALALAFPPDEVLGDIHMKFIEAAEELALREAAHYGAVMAGPEIGTEQIEAEGSEVSEAEIEQGDGEPGTEPAEALTDRDEDDMSDEEIADMDRKNEQAGLGLPDAPPRRAPSPQSRGR